MAPAYAHGACDTPLLGQTIGQCLEATAARVPETDALVSAHQRRRFSYAELDTATSLLARGLIAAGLEAGERIGIWAPNCWEWVVVQYATAKAGLILVNINPAYRTSELAYAVEQSGCRMVIAARGFKTSDYEAMLAEVEPQIATLERVVLLESPDWEELCGGAGASDEQLRERVAGLDFDDPINIQYTSGTTGYPKGATLTHHNILNNGYFCGELLGYSEADRICVPVPLYHCFGMVLGNLSAVSHGSCVVLPAPAFEPEATLRAIAEERCTSLYGVPTMFIAQLDHPDFASFDLGALRTGIMAGSPCPIEVMRRVERQMGIPEMGIAFGMTETSPASTQVRRDDSLERRCGTVGQVHPHAEVRIVDPASGRTVERGQPGEFLARGYLVMRGYWNDPERTAEAIDAGGWMHTGDLATMDDDGYVNIVGRIKDMIIRGGENVYPREVEEFLYGHPDIADVQVIGVPDPRYGEELMAWVIAREGATLSEDDVRAFCKGQIAHYKIPRYVRITTEFPMTVTGKIQKFKLRELAIAELGLEVAATA
jgi:fatty-acyl-CoA synthase